MNFRIFQACFFLFPLMACVTPVEFLPYDRQRDSLAIDTKVGRDSYWLSDDYFFNIDKASSGSHTKTTVLYVNSKPAGFAITQQRDGKEGYLKVIWIAKNYRGLGWSEKLLDYVMKDLKQEGSSFVTLATRNSNVTAFRFFVGMGFKVIHRDWDYIHMQAPL